MQYLGKCKDTSRDKNIHILVIDETCAKKERKGVEAEQIFVLTTGNFQNVSQDEKCVYKYQCVDQILSEILEIYFERTKENMMRSVKKESVKMLAVYSPIHRAGRQALQWRLEKNWRDVKSAVFESGRIFRIWRNIYTGRRWKSWRRPVLYKTGEQ